MLLAEMSSGESKFYARLKIYKPWRAGAWIGETLNVQFTLLLALPSREDAGLSAPPFCIALSDTVV